MTDLSAGAARTLELLRDADGPLSYEELAAGGVRWPGEVYELPLVGEPKRMDGCDSATPCPRASSSRSAADVGRALGRHLVTQVTPAMLGII